MTCYMRHMGWLFQEIELPDGTSERRMVDRAIRDVLGLPEEAHCPQVWAAIKALDDSGRARLASGVAGRLGAEA